MSMTSPRPADCHLRGRLRMDRRARPRAQFAELRVVRQRSAAGEDRRFDDHAQRVAFDHRAADRIERGIAGIAGARRRARGCALDLIGRRKRDAERFGERDEHVAVGPRFARRRERRRRPAARRRRDSVVVPRLLERAACRQHQRRELGRLGHEEIADDDERRRFAARRARAWRSGQCSTGFTPRSESAASFPPRAASNIACGPGAASPRGNIPIASAPRALACSPRTNVCRPCPRRERFGPRVDGRAFGRRRRRPRPTRRASRLRNRFDRVGERRRAYAAQPVRRR